jgi:hypothetical protein
MADEYVTRVDEHAEAVYRSASMNALLGIGAAGVAAPFVAPYVHKAIDKLTGPDDGPQVFIQPGTVKPPNDDA